MSTQPTAAPECPLCSGTGWKMVEIERNGRRVEQAQRCDCFRKAQTSRIIAAARIPKRYEHCELANFEIEWEGKTNSSLATAKLFAGTFVENYPIEQRGLIFHGDCGVGKTHLAVGILKELIRQKSARCLFYDYRELLKEIQHSYNASVSVTELDVLRPIFEAEVLVIDEIGAVRSTEWVMDTVSVILNNRYNENRVTIITTNYRFAPSRSREETEAGTRLSDMQALQRGESIGDRIGDRMFSRLNEMCKAIEIFAGDYRRRVKNASFRR